jgi:transcriptional regulator with XRE-family HTH domain
MGQRLKQARQHTGMTIRELGTIAGIASSVVADTENEKRIPRADTVERMAWALKISACWLAYGEGKAPAWYSEADARS